MTLFWIAWIVVAVLAGLALARPRPDGGAPDSDIGFEAVWVGVVAATLIAGALALVLPREAIWAVLGGSAVVMLFRSRVSASAAFGLIARHKASTAVVLGLGLAIAYEASRFPIYFDTAFYHAQMARIVAEYGTLNGAALLHPNYGQVSLWFSAAAVWMFGGAAALGLGFLNGLFAFVAMAHAVIAVRRVWDGAGDVATFIPAVGFPIVLFLALRWDMIASLSPDFPVMVLTVVMAWALSLSRRPLGLALLAATAACLVKISAAPLALLVGVWALIRWRDDLPRLLGFGMAILVATGLFVFSSVAASGCAVYPVAFTCVDVPWAMTDAAVTAHAVLISSAAFGGGEVVRSGMSWIDIASRFVTRDISGAAVVVLFLAAMATAAIWRGTRRSWAFWLALVGGAFVLATAPTGRFLIGPAAVASALATSRLPPLIGSAWPRGSILVAGLGYGVMLALALQTAPGTGLRAELRERHWSSPVAARLDGLIVPSSVLVFDIKAVPPEFDPTNPGRFEILSNGVVDLWGPATRSECWAMAPPCALRGVPADLRLADPAKGVAGGFVTEPPR